MWPTDEFELDYSAYTQTSVPPQNVTTLKTSAPMTVMDYSQTTPDNPSVNTVNNIQGELPAFMREAGNALEQFYQKYEAITHSGITPSGTQIVQPPPPPNKNLVPLGILAAILLFA